MPGQASCSFKHANKTVVLGIGGALGHDANAALIVDGKLIASSQEERFTRVKHDGRFPAHAIRDCLQIASLETQDVTVCVFAEKPLQSSLFKASGRANSRISRWLGNLLPPAWCGFYNAPARRMLPNAKFCYAWHHLSHVAGAFYTSPFESSAFLCVDGKGEDLNASIGRVGHHYLEMTHEQQYENGLGLLYTLVTIYLGFPSFGSEYKVMGLAPYGEPTYAARLRQITQQDACGGLRLSDQVAFTDESLIAAVKLVADATGIPPRTEEVPLNADYINIAASLQHIFEEEVFKMADFAREQTGEKNLIFCGGCAQNCVVAGKLRKSGMYEGVFNSPVGGDMGSGLGAALLYERERNKGSRLTVETRGFYLGSEPGEVPVEAEPYRLKYEGTIHGFIAKMLANGKIIGWVRGGMELGARALGARSILADPRIADMQSMLNLKIKFRESFRPFAPSILAEDTAAWFDTNEPSDYMQYTAYLKPEHRYPLPEKFISFRERLDYPRCAVPSIIHVDYSARLQTIDAKIHPDFHQLISEFKRITGVPIVINTSFNVSGQPIVRTAKEAWECFLNTDIDILVVNDSAFRNPFEKSREEKLAWRKQFASAA
jgi:carbamoyltransferase